MVGFLDSWIVGWLDLLDSCIVCRLKGWMLDGLKVDLRIVGWLYGWLFG
jgi:hypothetical protein